MPHVTPDSSRHVHPHLSLRFLARCTLTILNLPGLFQLVSFVLILRHYIDHVIEYLGGVWDPAFPPAFSYWIALLATLPVFSAVQLVWLLISFLVRRMLGARTKVNGQGVSALREDEGYMMLNGGESDHPQSRSRSHSVRTRLSFPTFNTVLWAAQLVFYAAIALLGLHKYHNYEYPGDVRFRPALHQALARPRPQGYACGEKIFIAAAFHNNEQVLPYWTSSMLDAISWMGTQNVFVSVVENYSDDRSPDILRDFEEELTRRGIKNRILVQDETIKRPPDMSWNARIAFLASIRNQALQPLIARGGYDKILFSNDILVEPESIIELLETRDGNFDFACGMDFGHYGAYDAWVLRDRTGRLAAAYWPFFFDTASYEAMKKEEPVPVFTCWNGIVAFRADPVLPVHLRSNTTLSTAPLPHALPAHHPYLGKLGTSPALTPPLVFRANAESEKCYSSESFLLPYDLRRVMNLEEIYVNTRVVVGYGWKHYVWHKWVLRHPYVKWFVERVYDGAWMQYARMVVGGAEKSWMWDGIECHPWW